MSVKKISEHPILVALVGITAGVTSLVTISDFVNEGAKRLNIWVVLIFLLACWLYFLHLLIVPVRNSSTRRKGTTVRKRKWILYIPVLGLPVIMGVVFFVEDTNGKCIDPGTAVTIGVANFEKSQQQDFSTVLISSLKHKVRGNDEALLIKYIPDFFDVKNDDDLRLAQLQATALENCINQGLIIYGYWIEKTSYNLFHGYIFIQDNEPRKKSVTRHPRRMLDSLHFEIELPEKFPFDLPNTVDRLADAALGIVKFYDGSFAEAKRMFQKQNVSYSDPSIFHLASQRTPVINYPEGDNFKSMTEFYIATIELIEGDLEGATKRFRYSYVLDSTNQASLHNYQYLKQKQGPVVVNSSPTDTPQPLSDRKGGHERKGGKLSHSSKGSNNLPPDETKVVADTTTSEDTVKQAVSLNNVSVPPERETFHQDADVLLFAENNKYGVWDQDHVVLTDRLYDKIYIPAFDGILKVKLNGRIGFITLKGKPLTECKYDAAHDFIEGMAAVRQEGKWGFINRQGKEVIPCKYEQVISDFFRETAVVSDGGRKAIRINKQGGKVRDEKLH